MTLPPSAAAYLAAVALLAVAGAAKAARPHDTAVALERTGWRIRPGRASALVRVGSVAEMAAAMAALVEPGPVPAVLVAACYGAFALFTVAALARHWPLSSCGCFGRPDTRPTAAHVVFDAAAVAAAGWWAATTASSVPALFGRQPVTGVAVAVAGAVIAFLAYSVVTSPVAQARGRRTS